MTRDFNVLGYFMTSNEAKIDIEKKKEKYKDYMTIPQKDIKEVVRYLHHKLDCKPSKRNEEKQFIKIMETNAYHSILNNGIKKEDMRVEVFRISNNKKSSIYYQTSNENEIYVAFEYRTGYIYSNCKQLLLELHIYRGINNEDVERNNDIFKNYLSSLELYLNKEY